MKKLILLSAIGLACLSSCKMSQLTSYSDDVYANPAEEKKLEQIAAAEKTKQEALEKQKREDNIAAQRAKDDANPYYKDPEYNKDDYYDYEYASRMNRFQNPIYGASYYDPYYTNLYTYNQNPSCYGTSIYSTYNYGMPSSQFNNYSIGISTGWGYNNYGYNTGYSSFGYSSGYNNYYNDPFYNPYGYGYGSMGYYGGGYGYNNWAYSNGYNMGYYNGYNNAQWGYYNSFDPNSAYGQVHYGPRGTNGGGNTGPRTSQGIQGQDENSRNSYFQSVAEKQNNSPRFANTAGRNNARSSGGNYSNGVPVNSGNGSFNNTSNDRDPNQRDYQRQPVNTQGQTNSDRSNDRVINRREGTRVDENNNGQNRSNNTTNNGGNNGGWNNNSGNSNSGGGGRSGGGGGNTRPR